MGLLRSVRSRVAVGLTLFAVVALGCGAPHNTGPTQPATPLTSLPSLPPSNGVPLLGISAVPRLQPTPKTQDYLDAFDLVRRADARADLEFATWADLESSAGLTRLTDALNYQGNSRGLELLVGIKVIDTTVKATPADLTAAAFDSPELKRRFHTLIDALKPSINPHVRYLSIGNEVDAYLGAHPGQWDAYLRFYADAVSYVHSTLPGVQVGVTSTYGGASGSTAGRIAELNRLSDVEILTYYPLGAGYIPRPPSTVRADLAAMVTLAGKLPLVLQEVGYPSDARLGSSEQAQSAFVAEVLSAWRTAGAKIPLLNWFALHDFTTDLCDQQTRYYGLPNDPNFGAFLCSLGLRRADGTPKAAWQIMLDRPRG